MLSRTALARGRWGASLGLVVVVALHLVGALPFQETLRILTFQLYQAAEPRERVSAPVAIVDIDADSLEKFGPWPWPRNLTARFLDRIWRMQPSVVALDIQMPEIDPFSACEITRYVPGIDSSLVRRVCALPGNDRVLAESLRRGKAILSVSGVNGVFSDIPRSPSMRVIGDDPGAAMRRFDSLATSLPELHLAAAGLALSNIDVRYGVARKVPMVATVGNAAAPSLPLEMLRLANGDPAFAVRAEGRRIEAVSAGGRFIATQEDGSLWIRFGKHDSARFVSAARVLDGSLAPGALRGKMVLVGLSGHSAADVYTTTLGERVPGVEIHAQILESIADGTTLHRPHWALWVEGALMLAIGLAISWIFPHMRARVILPIMALTIGLMWYLGLAAYQHAHLLFDVASPISMFVVMFAFMLADSLIREEFHRKSLTERLAREAVERVSLEHDLAAQRENAARSRGEMEAAMRIQMGMLPDVRVNFAGEPRLDIAACMEPAKMVGGDLYDCFMVDEHRALFVIGDVCGKGVPASLFMVVSKTLCRSLALRDALAQSDPGVLMRQANLEISRDNPEMLFLTAFIGLLDLRTGELSYCNAGHDRPLILFPGCRPTELDGSHGPPICVVDNFDYETHRRQLAPGESICMFTDGVTEALDSAGEMYGKWRLDAVLTRNEGHGTAQDVVGAVCASVHGFATDVEPSDDLTVMVIRWTPS